MAQLHYRPEIDGLRALAVWSVVFFYAGLSGFDGGYLGVDVFFVISGYLISSIIFSELELALIYCGMSKVTLTATNSLPFQEEKLTRAAWSEL